jgi:hypothetical protein
MHGVALQAELLVHGKFIQQGQLRRTHFAIGNQGQGDDTGSRLRAVFVVLAHVKSFF